MVDDLEDPRRHDPSGEAPERSMLEAWLEFHRVTLLLKCEGVERSGSQNTARPHIESLPPWPGASHGRSRAQLVPACPAGRERALHLGRSTGRRQRARPARQCGVVGGSRAWQAECARSRGVAAQHGLDDTGVRRGASFSLRWIYVHMIEEYARHNGHADLIRELVDGEVGC